MSERDKSVIFASLREILAEYRDDLVVVTDSDDNFYLDTSYIMKNKKPMYFGSTIIKKSYVSYYLMPVYEKPELLDNISDALRKRMQGKSCFNFKKVDTDLFDELKALTKAGFDSYVEQGYISS